MKKKVIALILVLVCVIFTGYSQVNSGYRQLANEKTIPKKIKNVFNEQYPEGSVISWYVTHISYWQNDYSSGWYTDWYGQRTIVVYNYGKPSYYEVEFLNKYGERSRAIYNVYGYWYETRSQLRGLPIEIIESLAQTKYSNWKVSPLKEKIESPGWPLDIYRFRVSKGLKAQIIRMDEKGNIIQTKQLHE